MILKRLCAWCGKFLGGSRTAKIVSHGMCPECYRNETGWSQWQQLCSDLGGEG